MDSLDSSSSLTRLKEQHRAYQAKLESLSQQPYLSVEEQLEEVRLKKLKLHVKDEMVSIQGAYSA